MQHGKSRTKPASAEAAGASLQTPTLEWSGQSAANLRPLAISLQLAPNRVSMDRNAPGGKAEGEWKSKGRRSE